MAPGDGGAAGPDSLPSPLHHGDGGVGGALSLDDVSLGQLATGLEGHAAWVLSHGALTERIAACDGPRTTSVGRVGPPVVLGIFAAAGWWARCHTPSELQVARAAGFPADRIVASGRVKDDGFLKDALGVSVGVLETLDASDAANVTRLAAFLECEPPPSAGQPPDVAACELMGCGGLLAPVLRGQPHVAVDAPWSAWSPAAGTDAPLHVWPVEHSGAPSDGTLEGLTSVAAAPARAARIHGQLSRGSWALVLSELAFGRPFDDPAWPTPETVMTRDGVWRLLEERQAPE